METKGQAISEIISNEKLRGSLYSTLRCSHCGKKLIAYAAVDSLRFECEDYYDHKSYMANNGRYVHDLIALDLKEVTAILNYNPLL